MGLTTARRCRCSAESLTWDSNFLANAGHNLLLLSAEPWHLTSNGRERGLPLSLSPVSSVTFILGPDSMLEGPVLVAPSMDPAQQGTKPLPGQAQTHTVSICQCCTKVYDRVSKVLRTASRVVLFFIRVL
jgi:hypothetical protein